MSEQILGIYLSGTGNTRHCVERLVQDLDNTGTCIPIESEDVVSAIEKAQFIVLGYPVQFSNAPVMVRRFIMEHEEIWKGKKVLCLATMGLFSGDGAGCSARLLKKCGAIIVGGIHIKMPDAVCDSKLLKKSREENRNIVKNADRKLEETALAIKQGHYPKEGLGFFYHMAGLFGQRLWFYGKTKTYSDQLKVSDACVGCGLCEKVCPMHNIEIQEGKACGKGQCTMCYRCISMCSKKL